MELIKKLDRRKNKTGVQSILWGLFLCSLCNKEVERRLNDGLQAKSCSCGKIKHGETKTRLYKIWGHIKERCLNPTKEGYKHYGGRGIKICSEWLDEKDGYINFRDWSLNNGYKDDLTIDRMENNDGYEPNNCRWVSPAVNGQNHRNTRLCMGEVIELRKICKFGGYSQKRIAKAYNISPALLSNIVNNRIWKEVISA